MKNPKHLDAWQYIIDQSDSPAACKDTGKELLRQLARAVTIAEQTAKRTGELREHSADATRNIMPTLRRELATSKKHTLTELVAQQAKADELLRIATIENRYAEQLLNSIHAQLGAAFRTHRDELLQWIAARRLTDIHALGYTEHITPELHHIYDHLGITWQPQWNEGLTLGHTSRLPLVFRTGWHADVHPSAAWVWQHIALGDMRERKTLHYIAAYVDELPRIETPRHAAPTRRTFANS